MILGCRIGLLLPIAMILNGGLPLPAKTLTFDPEKCHIDVPDDWKDQNTAGNKVSVVNSDQTKSVVMRIAACGDDILVDDPGFLGGVEKAMIAQGAAITDRQPGTLAGLAARTIDATQQAPAGIVYSRMTLVMANGNAYGIVTSKVGSPPWQDDQLNGILNSFGFIGTPELHHQGETREDKIAELVGQIVGAFIALLAVFSIMKWLRRRRRTNGVNS
jgi:hypothetical protein